MRILVTIGGPVLALAGVAMLVLPGPGVVFIVLGLALLAVECEWARRVLALLGRALARARRAALPRDLTLRPSARHDHLRRGLLDRGVAGRICRSVSG